MAIEVAKFTAAKFTAVMVIKSNFELDFKQGFAFNPKAL